MPTAGAAAMLRHDAELALQRERQPDADREAVEGGDQRFLQIDVTGLAAAAPVEQRVVRIRRANGVLFTLADHRHIVAAADHANETRHVGYRGFIDPLQRRREVLLQDQGNNVMPFEVELGAGADIAQRRERRDHRRTARSSSDF